jgi:hypothetical protein
MNMAFFTPMVRRCEGIIATLALQENQQGMLIIFCRRSIKHASGLEINYKHAAIAALSRLFYPSSMKNTQLNKPAVWHKV